MNKKLKEYKTASGVTMPEKTAKELAKIYQRVASSLERLKSDVAKARSNHENK